MNTLPKDVREECMKEIEGLVKWQVLDKLLEICLLNQYLCIEVCGSSTDFKQCDAKWRCWTQTLGLTAEQKQIIEDYVHLHITIERSQGAVATATALANSMSPPASAIVAAGAAAPIT